MRERDDLKRRLAEKCDYDAVVKERDEALLAHVNCRSEKSGLREEIRCLRDGPYGYNAMRAERDALKATVERVKALPHMSWDSYGSPQYVWFDDLTRALAEPISKSLCGLDGCVEQSLLRMFHGYGECVERRKGERRHGDDCGTLTCGRRKGASDRRKPPSTYPLCRECGKWKQP
jgi:hypothetical protein